MTSVETPPRIIVPGSQGQTLLRTVMKLRSDIPTIDRVILVDRPGFAITLRDSGPDWTPREVNSGDTALHLLWALDDDAARLDIDNHPIPIAPGDTVLIPAGAGWQASPGLILLNIAGSAKGAAERTTDDRPPSPTHGIETFHGYNRETTYPAPPGMTISRWKITRPLSLPASRRDRFLIDLAAPVAISWPAGTDLIGRGECRHIAPFDAPIMLLPDGLGYVMAIEAGDGG